MTTQAIVTNKAQEALDFARQQAASAGHWIEFHNALFGIGGKVGELFPTQAERIAFGKTAEKKLIDRLLEELQGDDDGLPDVAGEDSDIAKEIRDHYA